MTMMMRVLTECMYPKEVRVAELGGGNTAMGRIVEQDDGRTAEKTNIPQMWKMAALMKMCPKQV